MKKQIVSLSLATLLVSPLLTHVQKINATIDDESIVLESPILHVFDGTSIGINADVIELIGIIRRKINKIMIGEKTDNGEFLGQYIINGKSYSVKELAQLEDRGQFSPEELNATLELAKKDLQICVEPFMETIHTVKAQILELIKESCKKRGIDNDTRQCGLLRWSEAEEGEEKRIFNQDITSFFLYDQFCTDLLNFLGDLIRSCPRGMAQFKMRIDKCQKARTFMKNIIGSRCTTPTAINALEQKFMRHLKENHIDKLTMSEITKERLESLFTKFINQKK